MTYRSDDGLGAAHGLWFAARVVAGIILAATWVAGTVTAAREGQWEPWFIGSFCLGMAVYAFRHMETHYPRDRWIALVMTVISLTLFFRFI